MPHKALLIEGSISKHLWNLSYPLLISLLSSFSFLLVDMYFVSMLSHHNLVALSYTRPLISFFTGIAIGVGIAVSSIVARKVGAHEFEQSKRYVGCSFLFVILLAAIITPAGIVSIHVIFYQLGADKESIHLIHQFMTIWYIGVVFLLLNVVATNTLRAYGKSKGIALFSILAVIINAGLDPLLIFTLHMGIAGAALAGLIARMTNLFLFCYLLHRDKLISIDLKTLRLAELFSSWRQMISIAIPASLTNAIGPIATFWITYWLARIAQPSVAGYGIAVQIEQMAVLPLYALSACVGPVIGQNFAAKQFQRTREVLQKSCFFAIIWGVFASLFLWFSGASLARIFSQNVSTIQVASHYLSVVPLSYMAWGVLMFVNASFNALGYPKRSTLLVFIRMILLFFPLSFFFMQLWGELGIFIAFSLSTIIIAFIGFIWAKQTVTRLSD